MVGSQANPFLSGLKVAVDRVDSDPDLRSRKRRIAATVAPDPQLHPFERCVANRPSLVGSVQADVSESISSLFDRGQNATLMPPLTPKSLPSARAKVLTAVIVALTLSVITAAKPAATLP